MQASCKKSKYFFGLSGILFLLVTGFPTEGEVGNSTWFRDPGCELRREVQFEGRIDPGIENHALEWGYTVHGFVILDPSSEGGYNSRGVLIQESKIMHYSGDILYMVS